MAVMVHNTSYEMKGPWLLDREQLLELDRIVAQQWESLLSYREHKIEEEVESEINKSSKDVRYPSADDRQKIRGRIEARTYYFRIEKVLTVFNKDGTQIQTSDFASLIQNPDMENRIVNGFLLSLKCANIECDLRLRSYNSNITLDVSPGTNDEARKLFVAIKGWLNRVKAPLWQRIARREMVYCAWWFVFACFLFMVIPFSSHTRKPEWQQIDQAHNLLKNGIDTNEMRDAVATTLAIISEYEKPTKQKVYFLPKWYIGLLITIFLLCTILTILPKIVVGIGKGERSIIWWRWWLRFISYTIPIVILSSFIWPSVTDWIKSFF